ncbi:MAG: glycosyltransferase family 4 protein [Eubacteriales bacterium]|nr:glycosyltransferase family 4 protein [Eubacteriales bacterium]
MNILFLTLLYPKETMAEVTANIRDKVQNQINQYQHAFIQGIDDTLQPTEKLDIVNSLPVGIFPRCYRKLFLRGGLRDRRIQELSCVNLPWFKQRQRERQAAKTIVAWAKQSEENRTVLLYTIYLPYMKAVQKAKKKIQNLRAAVIVTDLPNEWGLASGRTGVAKYLEQRRGNASLALCSQMDGFILLTEPMKEIVPVKQKPAMVLEGLILDEADSHTNRSIDKPEAVPAVLYTGTLNKELGIGELLEAFRDWPDCQLWLCGSGDLAQEAQRYAQQYENIHFFGLVPQAEAIQLQQRATILINPRSPDGVYTRYSFPSKTLEYMRSGKPVLCYPLEGIPAEYGAFLYFIKGTGAMGIRQSVEELLRIEPTARLRRGLAGRAYVLEQKNPRIQCQKLLHFLRSL